MGYMALAKFSLYSDLSFSFVVGYCSTLLGKTLGQLGVLTVLVLEVPSHTCPCTLSVWLVPTSSLLPLPSSLLGVDKVLGYALNEWLQDIRKNQLPGLLGGVGPMHSVVQLCEYLALRTLLCVLFTEQTEMKGSKENSQTWERVSREGDTF